jgi:hypothetical protein
LAKVLAAHDLDFAVTTTTHVGRREIGALERAAAAYESFGMISGGGGAEAQGTSLKLRSGLAQVQQVQTMLSSAICPDALRPSMLSAAAWLLRAVGFLAFDAGAYPLADELLDSAASVAKLSGNESMAARVAGTRARVASWNGDQLSAVSLCREPLQLGMRLAPTEESMLHAMHARSLGLQGDADGCRRAIELSDLAFGRIEPDEMAERPWSDQFTYAHQQGDTGRALLDLAAATGRDVYVPEAGVRQARAAIRHDPATTKRSVALSFASLAHGDLLAGAPDSALTNGRHALGMTLDGLESRRVWSDLRDLRALCRDRCPGNPAANELAADIEQAFMARSAPSASFAKRPDVPQFAPLPPGAYGPPEPL